MSKATPTYRCPQCGYGQDHASSIDGDQDPKAGDVALCMKCGDATLFTADLRHRRPTPAEQRQIDAQDDVRRARAAITSKASKSYWGRQAKEN